jgi:hypothetical protein
VKPKRDIHKVQGQQYRGDYENENWADTLFGVLVDRL